MTTTAINARSSVLTGARAQLDRFFSSVGQGFNAYLESQGRVEEIERLSSMSDKQLAEMELRREDIPRYVFRDLIHI